MQAGLEWVDGRSGVRWRASGVAVAAIALLACGGTGGNSGDAVDDASDRDGGVSANCGNGRVDPGEECDDGNRLNGDDCDWVCRNGTGEEPDALLPDPAAGHAEVDLEPAPLDLGVAAAALAAPESPGNRLPLVSDGTDYATVWPHWTGDGAAGEVDGTFVRFDAAGLRLDAPWTYHLGADSHGDWNLVPRSDLAWNGSGYGLVWSGRPVVPPGELPGVSFLVLDVDGKPLGEPVLVSRRVAFPDRLGIAWDGAGFALVGDRLGADTCGELSLSLIDSRGSPRGIGCRVVDDGLGLGGGATAAAPSVYAAAWTDWTDAGAGNVARFVVVDSDGSVLATGSLGREAEGLPVPPDVVWSGEEFAVVWVAPGETVETVRLCMARLSDRGEFLAPPTAAIELPYDELGEEIAVAFGSATFVVGWTSFDGRANIVRIDRNGTFVERVSTHPGGPPLQSGAVGVAAGASGFGLLGVLAPVDGAVPFGEPYFAHFRVVH
jgi:cysteine-rich repeat protein